MIHALREFVSKILLLLVCFYIKHKNVTNDEKIDWMALISWMQLLFFTLVFNKDSLGEIFNIIIFLISGKVQF